MKSPSKLSRRQFLQILAVGGAAGCVAGIFNKLPPSKKVLSETRLLIGTVINLTVVADTLDHAQKAIDITFAHMAALESIFSRFLPDSQLSLLNQRGSLSAPNSHLVHLIQQANRISENTGGLFDISIKPLVDLYEAENNKLIKIDETKLQKEISKVGYKNIYFTDQEICFTKPSMSISVDGIAKGYIVDQGVEILRREGFANVIVEAGGDLFASGKRDTSEFWRIGIQSPRQEHQSLLKNIKLSDCALATSGDYMNFYSADLENHHIINPFTGLSSTFLASASVLAPNCMQADAYATALMVMDPAQGIELIEQLNGVEAFLVTKKMETVCSTGFIYF